MDPLPQYLYLEDIIEENKEKNKDKKGKEQRIQQLFCNEGIQICLGVFDDPENQEQPKFYFNLMECGHVGIGGRSVSGKSTFLQTFIFSLLNKYSEKDITLYILDFNGGGMDIYTIASQVQQVIKEEEEEKTDSIFESIREELKRRKKMLSGGNFNQYKNRMGEEESIPLMVIVLDGFEEFCTVTYQKYEDILYQILREGEKLGILMIITVESFSGMNISMRLSDLLKTRICFYMKDTYSYTEAFNIIQIPVLPKKGIPGRGIAYYGERNLEFQTAEVRSQEESFMENGEDPGVGGEGYEVQEPDIRQDENPGITIPEEAEIADTPAEKLTETPIPTKLPILTEQPIPIQTVTASPSVTLTQKPVRKSVTDASKREKKQNPALSYYRTEPTGTLDRKKQKEQKPVIRMKTDGNRIRIEISPDIPFQILSFRINGKECDFYWQGKKLLAELPKKSRNPWKAELMGFVKSGKLYYETMDLPEKQ